MIEGIAAISVPSIAPRMAVMRNRNRGDDSVNHEAGWLRKLFIASMSVVLVSNLLIETRHILWLDRDLLEHSNAFVVPGVEQRKDFVKEVWDEVINVTEEEARCKRYHFDYDGRTTRRRVFLGSLIADESWHALQAVAAEGYGIYHTVAYVEADTTTANYPRDLRFKPGSAALSRLMGLYGPATKVTVDMAVLEHSDDTYVRDDHQRDYILHRWKVNGMRSDDIGIVGDADETFTRDFLRAAQICNVPFPKDCRDPKAIGRTMVFESTPDCITQERTWYHPDMVLGECLMFVGNEIAHPPVPRILNPEDGGIGYRHDEEVLDARRKANEPFPLINGPDIRRGAGFFRPKLREGYDWEAAASRTGQPTHYTAFHFHNFFDNATTLRHKMYTYMHYDKKAWERTLGDLQDDIQVAINCVMNRTDRGRHKYIRESVKGGLAAIEGPVPVFFTNETYRRERNEQFRKIVEEDEAVYGRSEH